MAIYKPSARLSLVGHLGTTEVFNTSFWVEYVGSDPLGQPDANALAVSAASILGTTALGELRTWLAPDCGYDEVRAYKYLPNYDNAYDVGRAPITGGVGFTAGHDLPFQCCGVASLRSGIAGRQNRGRMYIPCTAMALDGHQVPTLRVSALADALRNFFHAWNVAHPNNVVAIMSQGGKQGNAHIGPVSTVRVDSKVDIQRRRANREGVTSSHESDFL